MSSITPNSRIKSLIKSPEYKKMLIKQNQDLTSLMLFGVVLPHPSQQTIADSDELEPTPSN